MPRNYQSDAGRRVYQKINMGSFEINYVHWFTLFFLAGSVNSAAFLASSTFVTHVTGFATLFGVFVSQWDWISALKVFAIMFCFFFGVVGSGYLLGRPRDPQHYLLQYSKTLVGVSVCLFFASFAGYYDLLDQASSYVSTNSEFLCMCLLSIAGGLQNGAVTHVSGGIVRVTHLTGLITDLGLNTSKLHLAGADRKKAFQERRSLVMRLGFLGTFLIGSTLGATLFLRFGYLSVLFSSIIASSLAINLYFYSNKTVKKHSNKNEQPFQA